MNFHSTKRFLSKNPLKTFNDFVSWFGITVDGYHSLLGVIWDVNLVGHVNKFMVKLNKYQPDIYNYLHRHPMAKMVTYLLHFYSRRPIQLSITSIYLRGKMHDTGL